MFCIGLRIFPSREKHLVVFLYIFANIFYRFAKLRKKIRFLPLRKDLNCIDSSMYLCMFRNSENNGLFPNTDSGPHVICKYCRKTTVRFKITAQNNRSLANIASKPQVD